MKTRRRLRAFTLIELLTVIAILGLLAALVVPTLRHARSAAHTAREVAAARFLMQAYLLVPEDRRGELLPGSKNEPAYDEEGRSLGYFSARWPHRLAPYLGGRLRDTLFVNAQASYHDHLRATRPGDEASYTFSLTPSFGLNLYHVGGLYLGSGQLDRRYAPITRLDQADAPSRQLVFVSAANRAIHPDAGYFEARPPTQAGWPAAYHPARADSAQGWVSFRHSGDTAVTAWLDGHVSKENYAALRDMRLWSQAARRADDPAWRRP
jgi:prepilin-type N-terminal cleavage/methylation domain-containing protein/prepilin-type processing-associated H-X9-DG protein